MYSEIALLLTTSLVCCTGTGSLRNSHVL